jgi:hypothetical protein
MNYLKDLIREKKIIEADEEIENLFEQKDISDQAIIYKIVLGKSRFETEEEAREYLKSKWFWDYNISEDDNENWVAVSELNEMVEITDMKFEIGREATGFVANILPATLATSDVILFNEKGEVNLSSKFNTVDLIRDTIASAEYVHSGLIETYTSFSASLEYSQDIYLYYFL